MRNRVLMTGLILLSIFVFSVQVRAEEITKETGTEWRHTHTYTDMYEADTNSHADVKEKDQFVGGAKGDAPKLVQIYDDWFLGVEGGKDLVNTGIKDGWFAYAKMTYTGTLFKLFGK